MLKIDHEQQFVEDCDNVRDKEVLEFLFKKCLIIECTSSFVKSPRDVYAKVWHVYKLTCKAYYRTHDTLISTFEVFGSIHDCDKGIMPSAGDILYTVADALTMDDNFYEWADNMGGTAYFEDIKTVRGIQEKVSELLKHHSDMHDVKTSFKRRVPPAVLVELTTLMEDY
jgi:hypothetical protein